MSTYRGAWARVTIDKFKLLGAYGAYDYPTDLLRLLLHVHVHVRLRPLHRHLRRAGGEIAAICLSLYIHQRLWDTQTQRHKRHRDTQTPRDAARDIGRQRGMKGGAAPAGARACRAGSLAPSRPRPPPGRGKEEKGLSTQPRIQLLTQLSV